MRVLVLCAVVVAALAATDAKAWTPPPTDDAARLAVYLPLAHAAWPDSPCTDVEDIQVGVALLAGARGEQDPGTCTVRLAGGLTAEQFCDALVHELGHAAGYGHTDDPTAIHAPAGPWAYIMNSTSATWPACVAATAPTARYMAERYVREQLPAAPSWRVACTPMHDRHPRCRALRRGAKPRRFAIIAAPSGQVFAANQL